MSETSVIGEVFAAYDHGDHIACDCEVLVGSEYLRCWYVVRPGADGAPAHQQLSVMLEAGEIVPTLPPVVTPTAADLSAHAAARRWAIETGGITVGGVPITTDTTSQIKLAGAAQAAAAGLLPAEVAFKSRAGFVTVSPAQIGAVYAALVSHIQACYAAEREVAAAIDAGTINTLAAIDAHAAWPDNS